MSTVNVQPQAHEPITARTDDLVEGQDGAAHLPSVKDVVRKLTTKEGWLGSYDFSFLCMPQMPCSFGRKNKIPRATPFYGVEEEMPISLALICGFQHALAMIAGLITPPIIFASSLSLDAAMQNQMVAVSLISSGILSCVQMTRYPIPFTKRKYWMGTGLITVVGTSFSTLSTASAIFNTLYSNGTCPSTTVNGVTTRGACPEAYGYLIGTSTLVSILEMGLAFVSPKLLKKIFPPIVTGCVILLIGADLVGSSGFKNWGGGSGSCYGHPTSGIFELCPTIYAPKPLAWGDARFIGLGFLSYVTIILLEFFGSPAMKSASIIIGLIVGCIVAGPTGYIDGSSIKSAPAITFLWVKTFPLKVYAPAILPMMAVYIALAMEATGDITASSEASRQPVVGQLYDSRVQGGILADGVNGMLSGLFMNPPLSIFAQNNGVISITRCANRFAGYCCAGFLILFGVLAKISGVFLAIPNPVLGGVTTFLFTTVAVSGLKVISMCKFTRRDRIILASGLSLGIGNLLVPDWSSYIFTYSGDNHALLGFLDSIIIILETPFLIAGIICSLLNAILPHDEAETVVVDENDDESVTPPAGKQSSDAEDLKQA
ncbi:xanthine/uracil permease [Meredithblackwellia eburnea MCA 4105]